MGCDIILGFGDVGGMLLKSSGGRINCRYGSSCMRLRLPSLGVGGLLYLGA